ncbi:hypothetical protein AVEN_68672-1 [Araneus ventricosus]|uniref:Uncharacterized protein n=1 Tax=Araneus ventricosus TaxID=182803 RepID=A0A4Y2RHU9_ARAVE|nr:hypothetical protein AVEN_68672-1 [Araneus ventricosus]
MAGKVRARSEKKEYGNRRRNRPFSRGRNNSIERNFSNRGRNNFDSCNDRNLSNNSRGEPDNHNDRYFSNYNGRRNPNRNKREGFKHERETELVGNAGPSEVCPERLSSDQNYPYQLLRWNLY